MYVTGTTASATPASASASQASSTCGEPGHVGHRAAGGEVGQHHLLLGAGEDVGRLGHEVHAAEDDVLGARASGRVAGQLEGVAGDVGELDDLVALVVVAQHEDPVAEGLLGRPRPRDQVRVGGSGQVAGTLDAALGAEVGAAAEGQQGQVDGRHGPIRIRRLTAAPRGGGTASAAACPAAPGSPLVRSSSRAASPTSTAHSLAAVTCAIVACSPALGERGPQQPGRGAPVGGGQQRHRAAVDVGVAGAGGGVGDQQPPGARHHVVVGSVGGATGPAVDGVHQVDVARPCPPAPFDHRDALSGRRCRRAPSAGAA